MEWNWSRWSRCESSFGLLLVPHQPGIFALAEEVVESSSPDSRRLLAVFEINEAEDLAFALSRFFAPGSAWQERLLQTRCYLRYVIITDADKRRTAADALKRWLYSLLDNAAQVFEQPVHAHQEAATVAERAVDRVLANH
jgi:hypothetical protein